MKGGQAPTPPVLAVLRFPRRPATTQGRDLVSTHDGRPVMAVDVSRHGRQVDLTGPDGAPLGRVLVHRSGIWHLVAPHTGAVLADADVRWGVSVRIGQGPPATAKGRGDDWDLVWQQHALLAVRKTPRKVAERCLDVWVTDPACTPAVVAFAVHVRSWWVNAETTNQILLQQTLATPPPPPAAY